MAFAFVYLLVCASLGLARERRASNALLAASLAALMVCAQFAVLLTR